MRKSKYGEVIVGMKFGYLTVTSPYLDKFPQGYVQRYWKCSCDCGRDGIYREANLKNKNTSSCGCYHREQTSKYGKTIVTHFGCINGKETTEYRSWRSMLNRCYRKDNDNYKYYGARGISVCSRWLKSFNNFLSDMGKKPSSKHSINRINNDGNYSPINCNWATSKEQNLNKRRRYSVSPKVVK